MEYRKEVSIFKKLLSRERNEMWNKKCVEINTFLGGIPSAEVWKPIKILRLDKVEPEKGKQKYYKNK